MEDIETNFHKETSDDNLSTSSSHKDYNKLKGLSKEDKKEYLNILYKRFDSKKKQHNFTFEYYNKLHYAISIPSILLTSGTSILSFLNGVDDIPDESKGAINITIGVIASVITLANTFSNTFSFKTRAEMHNTCAKEYSKLLTEIQCEQIKLDDPNFITYIEEQELRIKGNMNYLIPSWIERKYE